ncbi:hypothetical protein SOVF_177680 [Spinacia oleracea]|nr:hypothetical protein SOVF_177680 [Spinacia oleracea]
MNPTNEAQEEQPNSNSNTTATTETAENHTKCKHGFRRSFRTSHVREVEEYQSSRMSGESDESFNFQNFDGWILQLEDTFHFFRLDEEAKLKAAIISLDGEAKRWFEWEHQRWPFYRWLELKNQVRRCFGSSPAVSWQKEPTTLMFDDKHRHSSSSHGYSGLTEIAAGTVSPRSETRWCQIEDSLMDLQSSHHKQSKILRKNWRRKSRSLKKM